MNYKFTIGLLVICLLVVGGCKKIVVEPKTDEEHVFDIPDWGAATHEKQDPVYETVFPDNQVNRIDITIDAGDWNKMLDDIEAQYGNFNNGSPITQDASNDFKDDDFTPIYVPCNVEFNGINWYKVGIRFRGNTSLKHAWNNGSYKIPFKLHFDKFEDEFPLIDDQRFYGFKKLSFNNNAGDASVIKEVLANKIFRNYELPVPQMCFYEVYIDHGDGSKYFGVYTMIENFDDTFIKDQFEGSKHNLYKPSGLGATFDEGTFNTSYFPKKANSSSADFSDVENLFNHLHSSDRIDNPAGWRYDLEKLLDLNTFLKWLAINSVIQNWDAYGIAAHNYYLYHDPETNKLTWIPTDMNQAFSPVNPIGDIVELDLSNVDDRWALISKITADPNYLSRYKHFVGQFADNVFTPSLINQLIDEQHQLVSASVMKETTPYSLHEVGEFSSSVATLKSHCTQRYDDAQALQ